MYALLKAITNNDVAQVRALLQTDVDFNQRYRTDYPLEAAIRTGSLELVQAFLESGEVTLCDARYWDNALDRPTYRQARRRLGAPTRDEVYAYVPALALGGSEDVAILQKVKLREHLSFLAQLRG